MDNWSPSTSASSSSSARPQRYASLGTEDTGQVEKACSAQCFPAQAAPKKWVWSTVHQESHDYVGNGFSADWWNLGYGGIGSLWNITRTWQRSLSCSYWSLGSMVPWQLNGYTPNKIDLAGPGPRLGWPGCVLSWTYVGPGPRASKNEVVEIKKKTVCKKRKKND